MAVTLVVSKVDEVLLNRWDIKINTGILDACI